MNQSASTSERLAGAASDSERVARARSRAEQRLGRQRGTLRPLGWAVIAVVAIGAFNAHPAPGLHGKAILVTAALIVFIATLAFAISDRFPTLATEAQAVVIAGLGAAGVALGALQPRGATGLAGGAAVWMALARLPLALGAALGALFTIGLACATALAGDSSSSVFANALLCALLGLMAYFMKQSRESQNRTELLMAQLEDAREEQIRSAEIAERGRIAAELHDVLAHSLSGAAIQLQGARMLADREHAEPPVRGAIDRASELVRDGLANARQAVGALRGEQLPTVSELGSLVAQFRDDMGIDATLRIEGIVRELPTNASLALYRGAQEALTNVARYAPGASTDVLLRYGRTTTTLSVEDRLAGGSAVASAPGRLAGVGGGRGLAGMRERIEGAGGTMRAGPTDSGWRVDLDVPT